MLVKLTPNQYFYYLEKKLTFFDLFKFRHLQKLTDHGSVSPTYLRTAFMPVTPKSVIIQSSCQYLFTLLGSTGAKAACRTLMKLRPGTKKGEWRVFEKSRGNEAIQKFQMIRDTFR